MTSEDTIPFLDLVTPHRELEEELVVTFRAALRSAGFIGGPLVEGFERDFAAYCGAAFCVGVASGTDAVRFALIAAGVKPGETVVTVPNTFIATTEAITQAGAVPDFVDIDEATAAMDTEKLAAYFEAECVRDDRTGRPVAKRTGSTVSALVPVHLYGQTVDMDPLRELAEKHRLVIIEDACQAHGADYFSKRRNRWERAGTLGAAGAFSFYPGKNLGACGEGGAVTTDDEALAAKIRMLRDHGQSRKYYHEIEGYNGRLDAVQAGMLGIKLKQLDRWNEARRQCARKYDELLSGIPGLRLPAAPSWTRPVYHLYVIRSPLRDEIQRHLLDNNIATGLHYPLPLHLQNAYRHLRFRQGDFPVAEKAASELLSLPLYPGLTEVQQARVALKSAEAVERAAARDRERTGMLLPAA